MQIPLGFGQITHFFGGPGLPQGAAIVHGIDLGAVLDPAVAAEDAWNAWDSNMAPLYTVDMRIESTLCKFGPNDTGNFGTFEGIASGASSGAMAPPNVAVLVEKKTSQGGRAGRGRMYIPGANEVNIGNNGALAPAFLTAVNTAAAGYLADLDTAGIPMVLLHNSVLAPTPVTSLVADPVAATQRRRLR